jgi:hypothetical protein
VLGSVGRGPARVLVEVDIRATLGIGHVSHGGSSSCCRVIGGREGLAVTGLVSRDAYRGEEASRGGSRAVNIYDCL